MRRRKKYKLFHEQKGLCSICNEPMNLFFGDGANLPKDYDATVEHQVSRWAGEGKRRNATLAHHRCNHQRGIDEEASQPFLEIFYRGFAGGNVGVPHCLRRTPIM